MGKRTAGRADYVLGLNAKAFEAGLRNARKRFQSIGSSLARTGRSLFLFGGAATAGLAATVKLFSDFDDQMRIVRAVTGATEAEFVRLTETARELGRTTSFTASQVANLQTILGRAGFGVDEIDSLTGSVLDLTKAVGGELEPTAGFFAAAIRQFNLGAEDGARVADAFTVAANNSFNSIDTLGEALKFAGPVASDFNLSIEETLALLGALGNVGIQGSAAGTALRRLLTLTGAEAEKLNSIFGVTFTDSAGNARPLVDVLDEVNTATKDLGTAARSEKFNEAFGLLGITGASAIAKNAVSVKELFDQIKAGEGAAAATAEEIESGIGGAIRRTLSAIEGFILAIGEPLAEPLTKFSEILNASLGNVTEFINNNKELILVVGGIATAATVAGVALAGLGLIFTGIAAAIGLVSSAVAFLFSPLGAAVIAVAGLGAAFVAAAVDIEGIGKTFGKTFEGIKTALQSGELELAAKIAGEGILLAIVSALGDVVEFFGGSVDKILELIKQIPKQLQITLKGVTKTLTVFAASFGRIFGIDPKQIETFQRGLKSVTDDLSASIDGIDVASFVDTYLNEDEIRKRFDALREQADFLANQTTPFGPELPPGFGETEDAAKRTAAAADEAKKALNSLAFGGFSARDIGQNIRQNEIKKLGDQLEGATKEQTNQLVEAIKGTGQRYTN